MTHLTRRQIARIVADLVVLAIGLSNLPSVLERPRVPFETETVADRVMITRVLDAEAAPGLAPGDEILQFGGAVVSRAEALELLGDLRRIDEPVPVHCLRTGHAWNATVRMIPYYESPRFAIVMAIVGFAIWFMGVFVASQRLDNAQSRALQWSLVLLGIALLLTQGRVEPGDVPSVARRVFLLLSYMCMTGGFFLFGLLYPRPHVGSVSRAFFLVSIPALVAACASSVLYIHATIVQSPESVDLFHHSYDLYHGLQALFASGLIVSLVLSYRAAPTREDRARLQWVLWGLVAGPLPFLLLIMVPNIVFSRDLIPEDIATAFLLITPFSLAVSFLRHELFDIEVLINRSIVYAVLTVFVGTVYALSVLLIASMIGGPVVYNEYVLVVAASLFVAFALNPIRRRLQHVVDATIFPIRSGFRQALGRITRALRSALGPEELGRVLVTDVPEFVPLKSAGVYIRRNDRLVRIAEFGHGLPLSITWDEAGTVDMAHATVVLPLRSEAGVVLGLFVGQGRREDERLTAEEKEFLQSLCLAASESLERLELQRSVLLETEERRRVEELNKLKSYFVSSVSHELRTPLTSIRMFAEMLRSKRTRSARQRSEYLRVIDHEAERLTRLIDNVLDFSRIERGVKEYRFERCAPGEIVRRAATAMAYPFAVARGVLKVRVARSLPEVRADADALEAAVINLISNGLKYSGTVKRVTVTVGRARGCVFIRVEDRGIGIPRDHREKIFDQFYRVRDGRAAQVGGMGLGLSLVKHIVDAHHGQITVDSVVGKGSVFTIALPIGTERRRDT